jgi:hypothetical protein
MFEIIGYLLSLILISFIVTIIVEYTKRFKFIEKMVVFFKDKVKKLSWYQLEAILIAIIILLILNLLNAITIGNFAIILNAIIIGLLSNGIFTYEIVKALLLKFKITSQFINKI